MRATVAAFLIVIVLVAACGSQPPSPSPSIALAIASSSPTPTASAAASPSASPSSTPQPTPTATATAAPPTASPVPTPVPTPVPWKSYTSKRYHYKISYPPDWAVTPGSGDYSDEFDAFGYPYLYIYRDTVPSGYVVSVSMTVAHDIAYDKSHYHATLVSNKPIKVDGWSGRIVTMKGADGAVKIQIQLVVLANGRVGYEIEMQSDQAVANSDTALFKRIYSSWRPT